MAASVPTTITPLLAFRRSPINIFLGVMYYKFGKSLEFIGIECVEYSTKDGIGKIKTNEHQVKFATNII